MTTTPTPAPRSRHLDTLTLHNVASPPVVGLALSPAAAAEALGICRASIYNLIKRGELRAVKIGRSTRIPVAELERLIGGSR